MNSPKILITGATGMLGAHLMWNLLQKGHSIRAIKRKTSSLNQTEKIFKFYNDKIGLHEDKIEWVEGDVMQAESLQNAMKGIDIVYHCAAMVSFADSPEKLLEINIQGTQNVLNAAKQNQIKKLCFVSSIGALDSSDKDKIIDESCFGNPKENSSPYSQSKYLSEKLVWDAMQEGLNAVIVNPGVILGYANDNNGSMQIFTAVRNGLPIYTLGGSGYVSVEDVCRAMILLTESDIKAEHFVLVSENLSNKELLFMMADAMLTRRPYIHGTRWLLMNLASIMEFIQKVSGKKMILDKGTARVALSRSYYSSEKIKKELGFEFSPIKKCVKEICEAIN